MDNSPDQIDRFTHRADRNFLKIEPRSRQPVYSSELTSFADLQQQYDLRAKMLASMELRNSIDE